MKATQQNVRKLLLTTMVLFGILVVSACSTKAPDPIYYRPSQQPTQRQSDRQWQYYNPPSKQYRQPYAASALAYYPPVPSSRYYSNPYADPAYGNYDSDHYYSTPNYANPYDEQQRELQEERAKSAGVADDKF